MALTCRIFRQVVSLVEYIGVIADDLSGFVKMRRSDPRRFCLCGPLYALCCLLLVVSTLQEVNLIRPQSDLPYYSSYCSPQRFAHLLNGGETSRKPMKLL
jgi:hypothetical protein